jgi:hypothetical protein
VHINTLWTTNPEGKKPIRRPSHRRECNPKINFWVTVEGYGLDSSGSGYGLVVGSYEHNNEPLGSIKDREFIIILASQELCSVISVSQLRTINTLTYSQSPLKTATTKLFHRQQ